MKVRFLLKVTAMPALLIGMLASCSNDGQNDENNEWKEIELTPQSRAAADNLNNFYMEFTKDVAEYVDKESESKNFVISPLSASFVLAMMGNAVEGDLKEEIIKYLGTEDLDGMNELASTLLNTLPKADKKTSMTLANSVWVNNSFKLNTDYSSLMEKSYDSEIFYFKGSEPRGVANDINRWCASKTDNKIDDFVNENDIDFLLVMMLNAMNFKSEWAYEGLFDAKNTDNKPFYGLSGETSVKTMTSKQTGMNCYFDDDFIYLSLPFGNASFRFEVVIPTDNMSIDALLSVLVHRIKEVRESTQWYTKVTLNLPKFSVTKKYKLDEALIAALPSLENENVLSLFTKEQTGLISFRQNISIEVDEKGAKAVVVSSGEGWLTSTGPDPSEPIEIDINRPFMFFITERSTGACVVSGRITDL